MKSIRMWAVGAIISLQALSVSAETLFGSSGTTLFTVETSTGAATLVGVGQDSLAGLAFGPNGTLYGSGSNLSRVNTATGATTFIGQLPELIVSLAFDNSGILWGIGNGTNTLWSLNPTTGSPLSGRFLSGLGAGGINEITFGRNGTLFGMGQGVLYTINALTANVVTTTSLSIGLFTQGLAFGSDDTLYTSRSTSGPSTLFSLNSSTGFMTAIGPSSLMPPAIILGALAAPVTAIPEPESLILLAIGLAAVAARLRRKIGIASID